MSGTKIRLSVHKRSFVRQQKGVRVLRQPLTSTRTSAGAAPPRPRPCPRAVETAVKGIESKYSSRTLPGLMNCAEGVCCTAAARMMPRFIPPLDPPFAGPLFQICSIKSAAAHESVRGIQRRSVVASWGKGRFLSLDNRIRAVARELGFPVVPKAL